MSIKKGFNVTVNLHLLKITCPGVWLCIKGKVSLQLHIFDSCIQTNNCQAVFPIKLNEHYAFQKMFHEARRLDELQRHLSNEWLYIELIQWQACDKGCVLASFQTSLDDLLYPTSHKGCIIGKNLDLLMIPTSIFPGTVAPKLHISTKTDIMEIFGNLDNTKDLIVVNPKVIISLSTTKSNSYPRKVCHSQTRSRQKPSQTVRKPPFIYRKPEDDLILRKNPNIVLKNDPFAFKQGSKQSKPSFRNTKNCCDNVVKNANLQKKFISNSCPNSPKSLQRSQLRNMVHRENVCPTCTKYEKYFSSQEKRCSNFRHLKPRTSSPCESDNESSSNYECFCIPKDICATNIQLARQLHKTIAEKISYNSRTLGKTCINCHDI